jgi:N-acetyl-gamma-glutamyl-phosphate reductase
MIRVGIAGGAGYTGGELIRILLRHPEAEIQFVHSNSQAGKFLWEVHGDLIGETDLSFSDGVDSEIDVLFLCAGHGKSGAFLAAFDFPDALRVIDLSNEFRLKSSRNDFLYGLPELNRERIREATHIANPGCFATCIQLALLPLAASQALQGEVHIQAITGSTGAGQQPGPTTHFSWRNNNLSVYKAFQHQHIPEIRQGLTQLQPDFSHDLNFVPIRGDFPRGIFASVYVNLDWVEEKAVLWYEEFYTHHPFTHHSPTNPHLKQVVNTNKALVHVEKHGKKLLIVSMIDNLLKGASGQAVQNMNLMFDLEETMGLQLKANFF